MSKSEKTGYHPCPFCGSLESRPLRRDSFRPSGGFTRFYYARQPLTRTIGGSTVKEKNEHTNLRHSY